MRLVGRFLDIFSAAKMMSKVYARACACVRVVLLSWEVRSSQQCTYCCLHRSFT